MSGVRMGERALQVGVADASLVGAIAAKVGLSGHAAVVVDQESDAEHARRAGTGSGALIDVSVAPFDGLPYASDSFDVIVVHSGRFAQPIAASGGIIREAFRVVRAGGRLVIIEGRGTGFAGRRLSPAPGDAAPILSALNDAGFRTTRVLAEREGYRFIEGLKHHL